MRLFRRFINPNSAESVAPPPPPALAQPSPLPPQDTEPVAPVVIDLTTRQLEAETLVVSRNARHIHGQSTDVGMSRTINQDAFLALTSSIASAVDVPDVGLYAVADGMGGHSNGEQASALVVRMLAADALEHLFLPLLRDIDEERVPPTEMLVEAVRRANTALLDAVPQGGTTLTAALVVQNVAYIAHVGDSRAYLVTKERIEAITRDHSMVQRLIELNQLTPEQAHDYPSKHVLYRALGQKDTLEVDSLTRRLPPRAFLLLCSDGLWSVVDEADIHAAILQAANPQEACDKLVAAANRRGGPDNITALLLALP